MWTQGNRTVVRKALSVIGLYREGFQIKLITHYALRVTIFLLFTIHCPLFTNIAFADDLKLQDLIDEALKNNPEILAYESKASAAKFRIPQAKSLPDPMLKLSVMNLPTDTFRFDQEPMTQKQISIMQKFPFPGKLELKGRIAEKELETVIEEYGEKKNEIIMKVKIAYQNLLFIDKSIEITEENKRLLKEFVKIAETKYEVGTGIQQDVLKAQVELSKVIDRIISLKQKRKTAAALLNVLLNRPVQTPFTETGEIEHSGFHAAFENLLEISEENRQALKGLRHQIERSTFSERLAEKDYYPDFDVGVSYGQRDNRPGIERADFFSAFLTIKIPLWYKSKQSRKVDEEKANIRKAREQYNAMRNIVSFQIKDIMAEIEKYNDQIELFRTGLIPQSRSSLESALSGYKVNKVDFITLVNNQITLYNYEIDYFRAITDHENKLAELEAAVGKRLTGDEFTD